MPYAALALFAASAGSLIVAYIAETFFGVEPCILCIYQRIPYALVTFLAIFALMARQNDKKARFFLALCALALFINAGIAGFHSGVELHWWAGTDECSVNPLVIQQVTADALREQLLHTPLVPCDAINFTFLGFTMANWNILASLGLGFFALLASLGSCITWGAGSHCCCCSKSKKD